MLPETWSTLMMPIEGGGVPLTNARAGLITPTAWTLAAVELMVCVRVMAQKVFVPCLSTASYLRKLKTA